MGLAKFYVCEIPKDGKSRNSRKLMSRNLMFAKINVLKSCIVLSFPPRGTCGLDNGEINNSCSLPEQKISRSFYTGSRRERESRGYII